MQDTPNYVQAGAAAAVLVEAFRITPAQADAALRSVQSEFAWHLERNTLSRRGLADLVAGAGQRPSRPVSRQLGHRARRGGARRWRRHPRPHPRHQDRSRALAARICRATRLSDPAVTSMLPVLAVLAMARLAAGASKGLGEVLAVMPPLGCWSRGSPHADLADILRRGCGGGPYAPARLRRAVRRAVAAPAGFPPRGALRWYVHFLLVRPLSRPVRAILARTSATSLAAAGPCGGAAAVVAWPARAAHALGYSRSVAGPAAAVLEGREVAPRPDCRAHGRAPSSDRSRSRRGSGRAGRSCRRPWSTSACRPSPFPAQRPSRRPQT